MENKDSCVYDSMQSSHVESVSPVVDQIEHMRARDSERSEL